MSKKPAISIIFTAAAFALVLTGLLLFQDAVTNEVAEVTPKEEIPAEEFPEPDPPAEKDLLICPKNPVPGDFLIVEAGPLAEEDSGVELAYNFPGPISSLYFSNGILYAVIGICYDTEPGGYRIALKEDPEKPEAALLDKEIMIVETEFQKQSFSMPPGITESWTAARLAEDREKIRRARETTEPYPLWVQTFIEPLEGPVTSEYGAIRIIDGNPPRRHGGVDIAAPEGTPIVAPNRGIVRLAEHLLAGGNTVIIDHGIDISSTYMHLHEISVEEGDKIERGEVIGTVGMTGYATGPHLHWEVNIGQNPVNPEQMLDNDLLLIPPSYLKDRASGSR